MVLRLLLDANMILVGMRMYPGNESEKPVIRTIIGDLKKQNNINGRTIQIADKGLNCARNIIEAVDKCDGYIFSKSVKQLPKKEKDWVLLDQGFKEIKYANNEVHYKYKSCIDEFTYKYIDENGNTHTKTVKEKRVCTFSPKLQKKKLLEIDKMVERAKKLRAAQAKKEEYGDSSRYVKFVDEDGNNAQVVINESKIESDRKLAGYNLLVTSEHTMDDTAIYEAYHNLWRIEESFRVMKNELDARPVYRKHQIKTCFFFRIKKRS